MTEGYKDQAMKEKGIREKAVYPPIGMMTAVHCGVCFMTSAKLTGSLAVESAAPFKSDCRFSSGAGGRPGSAEGDCSRSVQFFFFSLQAELPLLAGSEGARPKDAAWSN